ncbi:hypothetical protein [Streptomyces sp. NBC_00203]|uniref:hypothetical protein n=1 Tax=Streptomyces sp. NBC_00203 TaxID=2975680 RepID=UPI003247969F
MLTAEASNLVGCASGFPVRGDDSGGLGFDRALPIAVGRLTSADRALTFAFAGILVRPHARGRDEARRLQERLLTEHRASLGVTLADRPDQPILAALRCWDRTDVGDGRRAADGAVLLTLVLPLGVRTTTRPEGLDHRSWTRWSS